MVPEYYQMIFILVFPKKSGDITKALDFIVQSKLVGVWFESPKRIMKTMLYLTDIYPDLKAVLAKKVVKKPFELFIGGTVADI